jgi:hypothetical protein
VRVYNYYTQFTFSFNAMDIFVAIILLFFILLYGILKNDRQIESKPIYKYYFKGLVAKMLGAILFAVLFGVFYGGGDSIAYWYGAEALKNLFYSDPSLYFNEIFNPPRHENFFNHFNERIGWPPEWIYKSSRHFFISKLISVICIFVPNSFVGVTIVMGLISFHGTWRLFTTMCHHFPGLEKYFQLSILFLPSTLFWCSGIMKDTLVLAGVCWIVHETDMFLRKDVRRNYPRFILRLVVWTWIIFSCKPYILVALAPGWIIWMNYGIIVSIKSKLVKYYLLPIMFFGSFALVFQAYNSATLSTEFNPETMVDQALIVRNDFATNTTYGTNRFQAQAIEGGGGAQLLLVAPEAIVAGLFRPFIWEARSPFTILSALENSFVLLYALYALIKLRVVGFIRFCGSHPLLLFSIIFTIILAFIIGFTSMIFGALVRFRTPFLPFFVSLIIVAVGKIRKRNILLNYSIRSF